MRRLAVPRPQAANPRLAAQRVEIGRILHGPRVQTKLKVGAPDDAYEREADRVADAVMRMPEPQPTDKAPVLESHRQASLQRACAACEGELRRQPEENPEELRRQPEEKPEEEAETLRAKAVPGQTPAVTPGLETRVKAFRGGGRPLSDATRAFFEPRFGHDFSGVRVHADARGAEAARAVNARAFTLGRDVVFGAGQYAPTTSAGRRLLAHELTHVVQQRGVARGDETQAKPSTRQPAIGSLSHGPGRGALIQRIPKDPGDVPYDGEIIPWSAALRSKAEKRKASPYGNIIADLPRGHKVRVVGGGAWTFVRTHINGKDRVGYVSHELIKKVVSGSRTFTTDIGSPISLGRATSVPSLAYEIKWMKDQGLTSKVRRIPKSATNRYNCHGFIYLDANGWLDDPTSIIKDNAYFVPEKPDVDDAIMYTKTAPTLDSERRPVFKEIPPHSGIVTKGSPGSPTEATSKWGSWHLYQHRPADVWAEYGKPTFLRSKRAGGHTVTIKEKKIAP